MPSKDEALETEGRLQAVPMSERLALSVEEAGALLGISRDLAYDLVARGELPLVRLGRRLVVPRRALEEALGRPAEAGRTPARASPMASAASRSAVSRKWA